LNNRKVRIDFSSRFLGDTIAWIPVVNEFQLKHNCELFVSTFYNELFDKSYPKLHFINPGENVADIFASYNLGVFLDEKEAKYRHKRPWNSISLQTVAADILGINTKGEIKPRLSYERKPKRISENYVTISEHAHGSFKYWLYSKGWQYVVDFLRDYKIVPVVISKEKTELKNVVDLTNRPLEETINVMRYAKFHIGLASGLSWLAWALDVPVVMISGFSLPFEEFYTKYRVTNTNVCHGCFNDTAFIFNQKEAYWCPRKQNHICSRSITPDFVISFVQQAINNHIKDVRF